ncbi:uncharacterized protein hyls1 isoform X1 [Genypterus blacodes]|uniref:uncharacterized protein hyls1 isoform X1 n=1 Tax=Genypterus blacodes TaxID=154954 RepID=UPI003F774B2D
MYKMYNSQWDEESDDDDKNSLNSSFWSDGEREEEQEEIERLIMKDSGPVAGTEDDPREASEAEKSDLSKQDAVSGESLEESEMESGKEERRSNSPALSMLTSGYGTYRPEEPEGGEYRDDRTVTEFDQDSQGDLSEMRDDEDTEPTPRSGDEATLPGLVSEEGGTVQCAADEPHLEMDNKDVMDLKSEGDDHWPATMEVKSPTHRQPPDGRLRRAEEELSEKNVAAGEARRLGAEDEEREGSPRCADTKVIDSNVDFCCVTYEKTGKGRDRRQEVSGHSSEPAHSHSFVPSLGSSVTLTHRCKEFMLTRTSPTLQNNVCRNSGCGCVVADVASCLEELDLTASAQHQSHQGRTQSWEDDSTALSAFESYIRGMIQVQNGDVVRQKPKSFIRPALSQQTVRKDDPVAKYHQYKQVWEMCKIPGETDRRALRQEIKERLAYQPPPPKPRREFTPNTYTVPTEKKRSALRWEIRNALANRLLPHTCYRF